MKRGQLRRDTPSLDLLTEALNQDLPLIAQQVIAGIARPLDAGTRARMCAAIGVRISDAAGTSDLFVARLYTSQLARDAARKDKQP